MGLYSLGATIGATIAPPLVVWLAGRYRWPSAFVVTGAAGLVWLVPWLCLYRRPARDLGTGPDRETPSPGSTDGPTIGWVAVLRQGAVWRLMVARLLTDPVWYFYQFWFAKYLHADRGVEQGDLGMTWVVFLAADVGTLAGGWLSGRLIARGTDPVASRRRVMLGSACFVPLSMLVPWAPSVPSALGLAMIVVLAHLAWLINLTAMVVDLFPARTLATVFGIVAAGSAAGGIVMNSAVGRLVTSSSYDAAFTTMALAHPIAWLLIGRLSRPKRETAPGEPPEDGTIRDA